VVLELQHAPVLRNQHAVLTVPIPDLSFLVDYVILAQWAFQDPANPSELFYSDICGARVAPGQAATQSSALGQGSVGSAAASAGTETGSQEPMQGGSAHKIMFRNRMLESPRCLRESSEMLQVLKARAGMAN
jgi:hypothetical protein